MRDDNEERRVNDTLILENIKSIKESQDKLSERQEEINCKLFKKIDDLCASCYEYRERTYKDIIGQFKENNDKITLLNLALHDKADKKQVEDINIELKNKTGMIAVVTMILLVLVEGFKAGWKYIIKYVP